MPWLQNVKEGAQTSIYLAVADDIAGITGQYFTDCKVNNPLILVWLSLYNFFLTFSYPFDTDLTNFKVGTGPWSSKETLGNQWNLCQTQAGRATLLKMYKLMFF